MNISSLQAFVAVSFSSLQAFVAVTEEVGCILAAPPSLAKWLQ